MTTRTTLATLVCSFALISAGAAQTSPAPQQPGPHEAMQHSHEQASQQNHGMGQPGDAVDLLREAQSRPPLPLSRIQQLALANNPSLKQASQIVARSAGQARQAGLFPNPSIGYEGGEIRGGSFGGGEQGAFVQQTFPLGGKLGLRRRVFEERRKEDEIGVSEQQYRVLSDAGQHFYSALASQELVRVRRDLLNIALDAVQTANQLANVGQADAPDVLQSEVEAEQAKVDYNTAQLAFLQEFRSLAALVGQPDLPLSFLEGDLEEPPAIDQSQILQTVLRESPAVKRAQQGVVRAEAAVRSARREPAPDLQIRAGLQQNLEQLNDIGRKPVGVQGFATAGITLPIFNRNQGNIRAAEADLDLAREEVTRVQLSLRWAIQPLLQRYLSEGVQAARYRTEMIPRATRAYQLYLTKYRQMASAYPQVIVSQRTLFQLRVAYVQSLERLWMSAIRLQNYTLTGGLDAPAGSGPAATTSNAAAGVQE
jgi:cobalt-zinc-cadmium efflux system outer membrane protein